jgi:hypothetical protein
MELPWLFHQVALRRFLRSPDGQFFLAERRRLLDAPLFAELFNANHVFSIIKAVIILRGLIQKEQVEHYLKTQGKISLETHGRIKHHLIRDRFLQDIQFKFSWKDNNQMIILPFFNRAMNLIYTQEPDKLFDYPYSRLETDFSTSIIDAFEHYHFALFSSNFTNLIPLEVGDRSSRAFYQPDARMVLIINQQGRLDVGMFLFDRKIKKTNLTEIPIRLKRVLPAYFANDRIGLLAGLNQEGFLSKAYVGKMLQRRNTPFIRREKE